MVGERKQATVAVDINPATRSVVTGTELFTHEVCSRLPAAAPEFRWRFFASRPPAGLGVDVVVLPFRRMSSPVRVPVVLAKERPDLSSVPSPTVRMAPAGEAAPLV